MLPNNLIVRKYNGRSMERNTKVKNPTQKIFSELLGVLVNQTFCESKSIF